MKKNIPELIGNDCYEFAAGYSSLHEHANIKLLDYKLSLVDMLYSGTFEVEKDKNLNIGAMRSIMYLEEEKAIEDNFSIEIKDREINLAFTINRGPLENSIRIVIMSKLEELEVFTIDKQAFFSIVKITGARKKYKSKTIWNNKKTKYMEVINWFIDYLQTEYHEKRLAIGYQMIKENLEGIIDNMLNNDTYNIGRSRKKKK